MPEVTVDEFLVEHGISEQRRDFVKSWLDKGGIPPRLLKRLQREAIMTPEDRQPGSKGERAERRKTLMKVATDTSRKDWLDAQKVLNVLDEQQISRNAANKSKALADLAAARATIERLSGEPAAKEIAKLTAENAKLTAENTDLSAKLKASLVEQLALTKGAANG